METNKPNIRTLKALIKILNQNQLETLEFGDIKIVKSKHIIHEQSEIKKPANKPVKEYKHPLYTSQEEQDLWELSSQN